MYFFKAHTSAFMSHICILAFKKEYMYPHMFEISICIHIRMYVRENKTEFIAEFVCMHIRRISSLLQGSFAKKTYDFTHIYLLENKTEFIGECICIQGKNSVNARTHRITCIAFKKEYMNLYICMYFRENKTESIGKCIYGVATISRLLKLIGLFCKRAL